MREYNNFFEKCIAEPYEDKVRGLNLTPEQDKELRELYNRAFISSRALLWGAAGLMMIDLICSLNAVSRTVETKEWTACTWFAAFILVQIAGMGSLAFRMKRAEKQLNHKIKDIRTNTK